MRNGALCLGITPAWAGKSAESSGASGRERDHPRMGGEKSTSMPQTWRPTGSPPRGRGKVDVVGVRPAYDRITPAWAGKSPRFHYPDSVNEDHPRVGGEKIHHNGYYNSKWGSPPRGRGKDVYCTLRMISPGITPAWAGKRATAGTPARRRRDHPRVGGEKIPLQWYEFGAPGSPPRGRGKASRRSLTLINARITPAWAGKSLL